MQRSRFNGVHFGGIDDPVRQKRDLIDRMMGIVDGFEHHLNEWEQDFMHDMALKCSKDEYDWTPPMLMKLRDICGKVAKKVGEV